ncbi:MAG TPA: DUF393 domain-containing protein [Terriglobales bacterium]|nr:DUF393 domain-containing protein [Terriglobales bacterium]
MNQKPRLVYDGVCNLCIDAVRFLNLLDRNSQIQYTPFQTLGPNVRERYGLKVEALQGRMHLIQTNDTVLAGPEAIRKLCESLMPLRILCAIFSTSPARRLYEFIARRRYKIFGCRGYCYTVNRT